MFIRLCLLFIITPFVELILLIKISQHVGLLHTLILVIGTGILGAALAKHEGTQAWMRIRNAIAQGKLPANEVMDAFLILAAGLLLLTPGLITDILGFALLAPPSRLPIRTFLLSYLRKHFQLTTIISNSFNPTQSYTQDTDDVIDIEIKNHPGDKS